MLNQKIQDDLMTSLKAKDTQRVEALRLLKAEIKNAEIESGAPLDDEQIVAVVKKYVKKLREAIEMFEKGGREDLVHENRAQEAILSTYLPAEMSDEELAVAVQKIVDGNQELFQKNRNALIGIAMKQLSSQADPQRILKALQEL
jgi:uncharacterized protein YqeY